MNQKLAKGERAEEVFRNYFRGLGYFVARGCKFNFEGFEITDVDLFLYSKTSAIVRERVNVDIKNKRTPQAIERVFWAKGLNETLGFDSTIVCTTDNREAVKNFGLQNEVLILDGKFLKRLECSDKGEDTSRLNEEQLLFEINEYSGGKTGSDWSGRYELSKGRLLAPLTFDSVNSWLSEVGEFVKYIPISGECSSVVLRMIYLSVSKLLLAIDFVLSRYISATQDDRLVLLLNGFSFGGAGIKHAEKVRDMAAALAKGATGSEQTSESIRSAFNEQVEAVNANILAEFFCKGVVGKTLFEDACLLDRAGYEAEISNPVTLPNSCQAALGVLADFHEVDRKLVLF